MRFPRGIFCLLSCCLLLRYGEAGFLKKFEREIKRVADQAKSFVQERTSTFIDGTQNNPLSISNPNIQQESSSFDSTSEEELKIKLVSLGINDAETQAKYMSIVRQSVKTDVTIFIPSNRDENVASAKSVRLQSINENGNIHVDCRSILSSVQFSATESIYWRTVTQQGDNNRENKRTEIKPRGLSIEEILQIQSVLLQSMVDTGNWDALASIVSANKIVTKDTLLHGFNFSLAFSQAKKRIDAR